MSLNSISSIFPLPLTPFEQFTLFDDRPDHPMTFFIQVLVTGIVDNEAYEQALAESVLRHPLLMCRVENRKRRKVWILPEQKKLFFRVSENGKPLWDRNGDFIDLTKETGLRVWLRQDDHSAEFTFQFHHACCDGVGAVQFLGDVAVAYAAKTSSNNFQPAFDDLEPQRLQSRHHVLNRRQIPNPPTRLRILRGKIREIRKFFRQRPVPIQVVKGDGVLPHAGQPNIQWRALDRQTSRDLRSVARHFNATLNDLLLRDLLLTLRGWNEKQSGMPEKGDLRILVPTSLRAEGDQLLPASNVLGYVFITRSRKQLSNDDELLIGIRNDTRAILHYKLGWTFLELISAVQKWRGFLPLGNALFGRSCLATAIHSHLGNLMNQLGSRLGREGSKVRLGNLLIDRILCTPPLRPSTHVALATYVLSGQLYINVRCDPKKFTQADAQNFLLQFVSQLQSSASTANKLSV